MSAFNPPRDPEGCEASGSGMEAVTAIILGGGRGTRLYPLTLRRAKPAVGFAGKYRIIDIPVSNCINSGIKRIFVLTQFLSASLHRHIMQTYRFDEFTGGFVDILAAEQTACGSDWFQGPADAVRATLHHTTYYRSEEMLILSGDQLYRMNFADVIRFHRASRADVTVCVHPVSRAEAPRMGMVGVDDEGRVMRFVEKPQEADVIDSFRLGPGSSPLAEEARRDCYPASMGIYVFRPEVLSAGLAASNAEDFGKGVFQWALAHHTVVAYPFRDYWKDIGTVESFFEANISLTRPRPPFTLYLAGWPIYSRTRPLPPSRVIGSELRDSLLAEGAHVISSRVVDSVIGLRSVIRSGTSLKSVVLLGEDFYEGEQPFPEAGGVRADRPPIGIGRDCRIERAIIDKNVCIGDRVVISRKPAGSSFEGENYWVRDGITVIPKGAVIPAGTKI